MSMFRPTNGTARNFCQPPHASQRFEPLPVELYLQQGTFVQDTPPTYLSWPLPLNYEVIFYLVFCWWISKRMFSQKDGCLPHQSEQIFIRGAFYIFSSPSSFLTTWAHFPLINILCFDDDDIQVPTCSHILPTQPLPSHFLSLPLSFCLSLFLFQPLSLLRSDSTHLSQISSHYY